MNVERLHAIVRALKREVEFTESVSQLQLLTSSLENLVNSPQVPDYQQQVAGVLNHLRLELPDADSESFSPSWIQTIEELGIDDLLGAKLLATIESSVERNQLTPSVALDEIRPVTARVEELDKRLAELISGFEFFGIPTEDLAPGSVEFSVLIPRSAVDNELPDLGNEFVRIQRIVGPFLELATGSRPDLKVRSIASSDFGVFLEIAPQAAAFLAVATERVVALYRNVLDIRLKRQELADRGVPDEVLAPIEAHASDAVEAGIEQEVERLIEEVGRTDDRINELRTELRNSLNAIANRVDQGYNFDLRAEPEVEDDESEDSEGQGGNPEIQAAVARIRESAPGLKFIAPVGQPILALPEGSSDDSVPGSE